MSLLLSRLGRYSFAHPWRILLVWLAAIAAVAALLVTQPTSISSGITLRGTPSQQVLDTVSAEIPQARGTQGSLVFTADDGGRVDSPEQAHAIVDALRTAQATGYVVDREAKLADQQSQVTDRVTEQVEAKVAAELTPQLRATADSLDRQATALRSQAPATRTSPSGAAARANATGGAALVADLGRLADQAHQLADAPAREQIGGASALFSVLARLHAQAEASGRTLALPAAPEGLTDPQARVDQAVAEASAPILADLDRLTRGTDPVGTPLVVDGQSHRTVLVSPDGRTAVATVQLTEQVGDLPAGTLDQLLTTAGDGVAPAGLTMSASSSLLPVSPPVGGHEALGLAVAAVVLLLTLGSLVAAGLPLLTALVGVFIGVGGAFALSANYEMTTATPALGLMIGLAVGIDYALFIVHKQRSLVVHTGKPAGETIGLAVGTSGSAVVFAGITVVIALLGLLVLGIGFVNTMALTAAATVALAVLIAITALPALLGLVGDRVAGPRARARHSRPGRHRVAHGWIAAATRRPLLTVVAVVAVLGLAAVPAADLHLGMPSGSVAQPGSSQRIAYDAITDGFGEGANAPLVVTARRDSGAAFDQAGLLTTQQELAEVEGAVNVALMGVSPASDLAIYQVTPTAGPTEQATQDMVSRLRAADLPGLQPLGVTGLTAMNIDLSQRLAEALPIYLGVVVVLSLLVLLVVFRSLLVPVAATLGFLLTIAATLGLVVTFFQNPDFTRLIGVDRAGAVLSFLPIMATGILYGLANDYQVFLGSSIRESYVHGAEPREAIRTGFFHAGRVVVAAAVIMVSVFAGFVLSDDTTIRQFGFALSAGILIDAFLVRMTLIPAVLHLAGPHAWYLPAWLDRILPTVDVEGDRLSTADARTEPADTSATGPAPVPVDASVS